MKRYKYSVMALALVLGMSGCSLDTDTFDQKKGDNPYTSLKDIESGINGSYYELGYYYFLGNYAVILGDMCAGISNGSSATGHFYAYSSFTFSDTAEEIENIWENGYRIIDGTTIAINNAQKLMEDGTIVESEYPTAYNYIGQLYALKALAGYYLVNYFALPYSEANKQKPGIIVIDKEPTTAFAEVSRGTIEETYSQIVSDLNSAEEAFGNAGNAAETSAYYMGPMGLKALEARVYMALGRYGEAEDAAKEAIALKGNGDGTASDNVPSDDAYIAMWGNVVENDEDLFTIKKSDDDNLSANSLNTAYGSYYCTFQNAAIGKIGANDIRSSLLRAGDGGGTSSIKYDGKSSQAVSNIPIFRKSEMSLIIAECEARNGNITEARNYLMFTAKRDKDITSLDDLPSTTEGLLSFISDERIREFFGEGHRWFDARRMGDIVSGDQFSGWDIQKFVLPIPAAEINTGTGCTQNENWSDFLPQR